MVQHRWTLCEQASHEKDKHCMSPLNVSKIVKPLELESRMGFAWGGGRRKSCSTSIELEFWKMKKAGEIHCTMIYILLTWLHYALKNG